MNLLVLCRVEVRGLWNLPHKRREHWNNCSSQSDRDTGRDSTYCHCESRLSVAIARTDTRVPAAARAGPLAGGPAQRRGPPRGGARPRRRHSGRAENALSINRASRARAATTIYSGVTSGLNGISAAFCLWARGADRSRPPPRRSRSPQHA